MKIELERVHYMPKVLKPGVLYFSEEFGTAAHLCACGCGAKIRTPLGPTEWALKIKSGRPSLYPSVGNWQQACQSHYVIDKGEVIWCSNWTDKQIAAGRHKEEKSRQDYYEALDRKRGGALQRLWNWIKNPFER